MSLADLVGELVTTSIVVGSPATAVAHRSIGSPNSMIQFDGSGTTPSGPSQGNSGVIGKYGSRAAGRAARTLPISG